MTTAQVVIIEDEKAIADTLIHTLEIGGFAVHWFATAGEGLEYIKNNMPALLILDIGLPDANGFELCKKIREFSAVPIIFLTARNDEIDRVVGLEIGADDYVTKPFSPREVLARVKLRHSKPAIKASISLKPVSGLYAENFDYYFQNQALTLTALEFKLLDKLITHPRQVFSREQLLLSAQNHQDAIYARNVDSHIKAIRTKLRAVSAPACIHTKRGFGYYYEFT
ncbi:response regulator [Pseudoalteromonas arctica]|uniref:Response regulator n=1 Tax=Pseudoalteromonas arctica TaxID=394751 RepID=A0A7Y0HE94_9GAMM|nr:response regulator [Pseudoalteromonas arctica]NMM42727.1 response regulator [Pseudoalteromonas arctica]